MRSELLVRVTPKSSQNKLVVENGSVKVWVTAAPTDGQANQAVIRLVAKQLKLSANSVWVLKGHTSREKTLAIDGLDSDMMREKLGILER